MNKKKGLPFSLKESTLRIPEIFYIKDCLSILTSYNVSDQRRGNLHNFEGAVLDTGAQRSVIGKDQALAYCDMLTIGIDLAESQSIFVFGSDKQPSICLLKIIMLTPKGIITVLTDFVPAKIPFLIGLDLLDHLM